MTPTKESSVSPIMQKVRSHRTVFEQKGTSTRLGEWLFVSRMVILVVGVATTTGNLARSLADLGLPSSVLRDCDLSQSRHATSA